MTAPATQLESPIGSLAVASPQTIVCHCLHISQDEIEYTIQSGAASSVKCVIRETGAGGGCTACHCTIRSLLEAAGHTVQCTSPHMQPAQRTAGEPIQMAG